MSQIRLLINYGGSKTFDPAINKERRILPGVYDENDERLMGLAEYLVENGHAEALGPIGQVVAALKGEQVPPEDDAPKPSRSAKK